MVFDARCTGEWKWHMALPARLHDVRAERKALWRDRDTVSRAVDTYG